MRLLMLITVVATLSVVAAGAAQADPDGTAWGPATPNFNLEVVLRPTAAGPENSFGLVKFRQPKDAETKIYLDTWVRDLAPGHTYTLERAVDTFVNGACVETGWLALGTIATDDNGTGRAALTRTIPAALVGIEFDIHFRIVDGTVPVLESDCYQYVVSQ
jgi:hypothetical protein